MLEGVIQILNQLLILRILTVTGLSAIQAGSAV